MVIKEIGMPFEFKRLEIQDVILIEPKVFEDERGFFMETYKKLEELGLRMRNWKDALKDYLIEKGYSD